MDDYSEVAIWVETQDDLCEQGIGGSLQFWWKRIWFPHYFQRPTRKMTKNLIRAEEGRNYNHLPVRLQMLKCPEPEKLVWNPMWMFTGRTIV